MTTVNEVQMEELKASIPDCTDLPIAAIEGLTIGTTEPVGPSVNDLWIDTN